VSDLKEKISVQIHCPVCGKKGTLMVEENIIKTSQRGISAIQVAEDLVCPHSFVSYVDKNLAVRDSFACDFKIVLPDIEVPVQVDDKELKDFDLDIIKLNFIPTMMIRVLYGIFIGERIAIISDLEMINDHFIKFLHYVTVGSFNFHVEMISSIDYKKSKKRFKDYIVLKSGEIVRDNNDIMIKKNLKVPSVIVHQFFAEMDNVSSLIILKSNVQKTFTLMKDLMELNTSLKDDEKLSNLMAIKLFQAKYGTTVGIPYLEMLLYTVEKYHDIKLKKAPEATNFFGLLK